MHSAARTRNAQAHRQLGGSTGRRYGQSHAIGVWLALDRRKRLDHVWAADSSLSSPIFMSSNVASNLPGLVRLAVQSRAGRLHRSAAAALVQSSFVTRCRSPLLPLRPGCSYGRSPRCAPESRRRRSACAALDVHVEPAHERVARAGAARARSSRCRPSANSCSDDSPARLSSSAGDSAATGKPGLTVLVEVRPTPAEHRRPRGPARIWSGQGAFSGIRSEVDAGHHGFGGRHEQLPGTMAGSGMVLPLYSFRLEADLFRDVRRIGLAEERADEVRIVVRAAAALLDLDLFAVVRVLVQLPDRRSISAPRRRCTSSQIATRPARVDVLAHRPVAAQVAVALPRSPCLRRAPGTRNR